MPTTPILIGPFDPEFGDGAGVAVRWTLRKGPDPYAEFETEKKEGADPIIKPEPPPCPPRGEW